MILWITLFFSLMLSIPCIQAGWAEETLKSMTLEEKLGQLFMIEVRPELGSEHLQEVERLITEHHIGGLIFFKGLMQQQVELVNYFQVTSKHPLLIGQDAEWGLSMRLTDAPRFPKNMTLGALQKDALIILLGQEIARQCRALGVHVNFAPVVDINSNPDNPIIGVRSFGDAKRKVALKGGLFALGLESGGVLACAKHFPGHGDTSVDSHTALPLLEHSWKRLNDVEIFPFEVLIEQGLRAVMTAHLTVPALDASNLPATLSRPIVTDLLRKKLGFDGLIFTDGMNMKAITNTFGVPQAALRAIKAGCDIVLCPPDVRDSIAYIMGKIKKDHVLHNELNDHVLRVLRAKEWCGLDQARLVSSEGLHERVHHADLPFFKKALFQEAVTLLNNRDGKVPLDKAESVFIIDVGGGADSLNQDNKMYCALDDNSRTAMNIIEKSFDYKVAVVRLFAASKEQSFFGKMPSLSPVVQELLEGLALFHRNVIFVVCMSPYVLQHLPQYPTIVAYENDPDAVQAAMDVLWGRAQAPGVLPISL